MYALKKHIRPHQSEAEPVGPAMVSILCEMRHNGLAANLNLKDSVMSMETMSYGVRTIQPTFTPPPSHREGDQLHI